MPNSGENATWANSNSRTRSNHAVLQTKIEVQSERTSSADRRWPIQLRAAIFIIGAIGSWILIFQLAGLL